MTMVPAALVAGPMVLVLLSPWVAAGAFDGRAPARVVATFHLLTLVGLAAIPLVVLACTAVAGIARWPSCLLAVAYLARLTWISARMAHSTSRLAAGVLAAGHPVPASDGTATYVLAAGQPFAYAVGCRRAHAVVVSRGLLDLLDPRERTAVLAHELAHLRLRHHRALFFAQVVATTFGRLAPAARRARASLARELEVLADQEAARRTGDPLVLARALAKTALAGLAGWPRPITALSFGGEQDLTYRLDRLTDHPPREDRRLVAAAAVALLGATLLSILATTAHRSGLLAGLVLGLAVIGVCLPLLPRRR
jgi:Zn-dependent protease with chaperone function